MPIVEFMHVVGDSQRNHLERVLEKIHYYHSAQEVSGLEYLLAAERANNTVNELFQHLNTILIRAYLRDLSKEDGDRPIRPKFQNHLERLIGKGQEQSIPVNRYRSLILVNAFSASLLYYLLVFCFSSSRIHGPI